jgi:arylsulfatase A-like enzyme
MFRAIFAVNLIAGICIGCTAAKPAHAVGTRPNIVFIFADDHAAHAISAYGSKINRTPNIDRLAHEGMRFDNCFVTNSICTPSRATILTGKYSHLNGAFNVGDRFDGSQQTFPKLLQQAGYQTAIVGKWHLATEPTGFDYWNILIGQGPYYNPPMIENGVRTKHTGYTTDIITETSLQWLKEKRDPNKPFILMCQHKAPHRNWIPAPKHMDDYDDVTIPEPPDLFDRYENRASAAKLAQMRIADHLNNEDLLLDPPAEMNVEQREAWRNAYGKENDTFRNANLTGDAKTRWQYQRYIKDYLRCVASVDDSVGELLKYLEESGLAENTIVIYSSDQGFFLGDHGWFDKRFMYEPSLRMPLLARWPGHIKAGSHDAHMVTNVDYAQTFLDLAAAPQPDDMQGKSIVPLMLGQRAKDFRDAMYYHYYDFPAVHSVRPHYGVRTDRYKLIHYYTLNEWELFDLKKDPREMHSVYDDPAYAGTRAELEQRINDLQRHYKDTRPTLTPDELRKAGISPAAPATQSMRRPGLNGKARSASQPAK